MNLKQMFCKHNWKEQIALLANIAFIYMANSPIEESRMYTITYVCNKCGKAIEIEKYVDRSLIAEERELLLKESCRYTEMIKMQK